MVAALKDSFGPDVPVRIADAVVAVHPAFPVDAFLRDSLEGYEPLALTQRARHIARAMRTHLPVEYEAAIEVLMASLGPPIVEDELTGMAPFFYAPHVYFVAAYGLDDWETSMRAQYELTQRFSAEYSIRAFLDREPERTLARLRSWATDPSAHVRRLVSEGTRPRLPWAPRLRRFQVDPSPVVDLLELLKDDPSLYVRRSVANNLNDIGKDHPDVLVATCRRWLDGASQERRWLVRHALRSAVKRGERGALAVLGFNDLSTVVIADADVTPRRPAIGETVRVAFSVANAGQQPASFNVDLRVHFVKSSGRTSPKVFKVDSLDLEPGSSAAVSKLISLRQHTTRTHFPGEHAVDALVNGVAHPVGSFVLQRSG